MTRPDPLTGYEPAERLDFVQVGPEATGKVHVVSRVDWPLPWPYNTVTDPIALGVYLTADGYCRTICGRDIRQHLNGRNVDARYTDCFPDELICWRCHRAAGEQSDRLFRHDQPPEAIRALRESVHESGPHQSAEEGMS
jgi:hypothetical protein